MPVCHILLIFLWPDGLSIVHRHRPSRMNAIKLCYVWYGRSLRRKFGQVLLVELSLAQLLSSRQGMCRSDFEECSQAIEDFT